MNEPFRWGYTKISEFFSDDNTRSVVVYFGDEAHHALYWYADFMDTVQRDKSKFVIYPRAKYKLKTIEDEAEQYVLEKRELVG